ncbi:UDP-glucose 4-epimerase GalE [Pseudoxanthomonas mexicana]
MDETGDIRILVTGGAGYIGTHACVALAAAGYRFTVLDNFSNSRPEALARVEAITGMPVEFVRADIRDGEALDAVFSGSNIAAVIHFAGLKAVGESVEQPVAYYDNNVRGTLELLAAMERAGVRSLVFSSSATVYGQDAPVPMSETARCSATNPYGRSKLFVEHILEDACAANPRLAVAALRYFNPVGAHESGRIGEDPLGVPNNLMPYIAQVAVGRRERLHVFGDDYATRDGTGVRDYIHVMDLAEGHVAALRLLARALGYQAINLGTGKGTSVIEMLRAFERASGRTVPYVIESRRPGDVAECWADAGKAGELLGWKAVRDVDQMCVDTWRWQSANPSGYA